jgi:hypothetical protein
VFVLASVERDMRRSKAAFESLVWPVVSDMIGGGELLSMELEVSDRVKTLFDVSSGIDAWQYRDGFGMYGIASRVQHGRDWSTFTLRVARSSGCRTEAQKLLEAVESGDGRAFPKWFVQAYTTAQVDPLLSVAVCDTRVILDCWKSRCGEMRECENAKFFTMWWHQMAAKGFEVKTWRAARGR